MNTNDKVEEPTFNVKDCTIIVRMGGVSAAMNLRELRERTAICPIECLYHHFCETLIRPSFDDPEFSNDFAVWTSRYLRDRVLAERLGVINPYSLEDLEQLRATVVELIDERLDEVQGIPWVARGEEFRFLRAATIVFDTGIVFSHPVDFIRQLPNLSNSSLYYHFIEARRRTVDRVDDFTAWLNKLKTKPVRIIQALASVDFYCLNLIELKTALYNSLLGFEREDLFND